MTAASRPRGVGGSRALLLFQALPVPLVQANPSLRSFLSGWETSSSRILPPQQASCLAGSHAASQNNVPRSMFSHGNGSSPRAHLAGILHSGRCYLPLPPPSLKCSYVFPPPVLPSHTPMRASKGSAHLLSTNETFPSELKTELGSQLAAEKQARAALVWPEPPPGLRAAQGLTQQ